MFTPTSLAGWRGNKFCLKIRQLLIHVPGTYDHKYNNLPESYRVLHPFLQVTFNTLLDSWTLNDEDRSSIGCTFVYDFLVFRETHVNLTPPYGRPSISPESGAYVSTVRVVFTLPIMQAKSWIIYDWNSQKLSRNSSRRVPKNGFSNSDFTPRPSQMFICLQAR